MPDRRETLKIIGAIGTTCAFPFASDELYGQHVHPPPGVQSSYGAAKFFTRDELRTVSRIADLIVPGALDAGVPSYIDYVVNADDGWRKLFRESLADLRAAKFDELSEQDQVAVLEKHIDQPGDDLQTRLFRALKSMTADGYYTSKAGLVDDLGYQGNTVLESFPSCEIPEH